MPMIQIFYEDDVAQMYAIMLKNMACLYNREPIVKLMGDAFEDLLRYKMRDDIVIWVVNTGKSINVKKDKLKGKIHAMSYAIFEIISGADRLCDLFDAANKIGVSKNTGVPLSERFLQWSEKIWTSFNIKKVSMQTLRFKIKVNKSFILASPRQSATVVSTELLTSPGSYPNIYRTRLSLDHNNNDRLSPDLNTVIIYPCNSNKHIRECISLLNLTNTELWNVPSESTLDELRTNNILSNVVDLSLPPSRTLIHLLSLFTDNLTERKRLQELALSHHYTTLSQSIFTIFDLFAVAPGIRITLDILLKHVPHITGRHYAIASSFDYSDNNCCFDIIYSVPKKQLGTKYHYGLCSNYLRSRNPGDKIALSLKSARCPPLTCPSILFAIDSGYVPLRRLLQNYISVHLSSITPLNDRSNTYLSPNASSPPSHKIIVYYSFPDLFIKEFQSYDSTITFIPLSNETLQALKCIPTITTTPDTTIYYLGPKDDHASEIINITRPTIIYYTTSSPI